MENKKIFIIGGILIAGLLAYLLYLNLNVDGIKKVDLGVNPPKGNENATIVIVEFSDFQCPACKRAQPIISSILNEYDKKVVLYYRYFPLSFHENARIAAQAAQAASEQGKFWEYHDKLYENQDRLDQASLIKYAEELKLDTNKFVSDMDSNKINEIIDKDIEDGKKLQVQGTPTFFINGKQVLGGDETQIKKYIEENLK